MKINSAIAAAILAFTSGTYADEDVPKKASPAAVELPTFTVSPSRRLFILIRKPHADSLVTTCSLPASRLPSSSNSQTTGRPDGSLRTPRRTLLVPRRSGPTLASGLLRSPPSSRA